MGWQTTITKQGLSVLAGLEGQAISIVSAWAGSGVVASDELREQKELVKAKQILPVIEDRTVGNKRILRLQIMNKEVSATYTLNQLGVFIRVDDGEPLLYFIAQNMEGDVVPAKDAVSGFVAEYVMTLVFSETAEITIDAAETGFITPDALDVKLAGIKELIDTHINSLKEVTYDEIMSMYGGDVDEGDIGDAEIGVPYAEIDEMYDNDVVYSTDTGIPNDQIDEMYENDIVYSVDTGIPNNEIDEMY